MQIRRKQNKTGHQCGNRAAYFKTPFRDEARYGDRTGQRNEDSEHRDLHAVKDVVSWWLLEVMIWLKHFHPGIKNSGVSEASSP